MLWKTTYMQGKKKSQKGNPQTLLPFIEALWEICIFFYHGGFSVI